MKFRTLRDVALDTCALFLADPEGNKSALAIRALRNVLDELSIHIHANIVSKYFTIAENFTIQMPADCQDVLKVGVLCDNAKVRWMGRDNEIRRAIPASPGCTCSETTTAEDTCVACTCYGFVVEGKAGTREFYGYRVPYFPNGTYKYNERENRIELGSGYDVAADAQVLVEYRQAYGATDYNLIPAPFAVALMHKAASLLDARPVAEPHHLNEFRRAYTAYRNGKFVYTAEELVAALKGEYMSAPKN